MDDTRIKLNGPLTKFDECCIPLDCSCLSLKECVISSSLIQGSSLEYFTKLSKLSVLILGCLTEPDDEETQDKFYKKISYPVTNCPLMILDLRRSKMSSDAQRTFFSTVCQIKSLERIIVDKTLSKELLKKMPSKVLVGSSVGGEDKIVWENGRKMDFATVAAMVQKGEAIEDIRKDIDDSPDKSATPSLCVLKKPLKPWEKKKKSNRNQQDEEEVETESCQLNSNI